MINSRRLRLQSGDDRSGEDNHDEAELAARTLIYGLSEMAIDAGPGGNPVTLDGSGVSVAETPTQIHTLESN
jgi:hypothetical protein